MSQKAATKGKGSQAEARRKAEQARLYKRVNARIARRTRAELGPWHTPGNDGKIIGVEEAGKILGVTQRRVRALINEGKLPAIRVKRLYIIKYSDLMTFANRPRPTGRPKSVKITI